MPNFLEAVIASGNSMSGWNGFSVFGAGNRGSLPTPFDAPAGNRLWGPQGSHPLAAIGLEELVSAVVTRAPAMPARARGSGRTMRRSELPRSSSSSFLARHGSQPARCWSTSSAQPAPVTACSPATP